MYNFLRNTHTEMDCSHDETDHVGDFDGFTKVEVENSHVLSREFVGVVSKEGVQMDDSQNPCALYVSPKKV